MTKKLLLIGSSTGSVHLKNYYNLIADYFDEILVVSGENINFCENKIIDFSLKNPFKVQKSINKLRKIIYEFSPSLIHVHQANTYGFITSRANKGKVTQILTTWGSDVLILPNKGFLYKHMVKYSLKKSDYITADANFMAESIAKFTAKKVTIANFGIEYKSIEFPEKENVIYSNRLHNPLYRIEEIIKGFSEFVKTNPSWKLVIGANGSETTNLGKLAKTILPKDSYKFIGFVSQEENKKQYLHSKIWISNPISDGTAISLLEAMGYGCVPVVSDLPANNEWIINNKNGIIIKSSITNALNCAKNLPLETVQKENKKLIIEKATKKVNKTKFESIYSKILEK